MRKILFTDRQLREFLRCQAQLQEIFMELVSTWPDGQTVEITSIYRSAAERIPGSSGIHGAGPPFRAIDVRIKTIHEELAIAQGAADVMADVLNSRWAYDPRRPNLGVAVSAQHGTGPHIHLQVHARTERKT